MRTFKWLAMTALAVSTTACVQTVDQGYGYSDGYSAPSQAYYPQQSSYAPTYYQPAYQPTRVVTQTRYVPVPVAVPQNRPNDHRANDQRSNDHRPDGNRGDHHDRPQANNTPPAPHQPATNNNQHRGNDNSNGNGRDRDGDGRPDRRN